MDHEEISTPINRRGRRINIRHLRAFLAVAKCHSLARAADMLFVTPSALSLTIGNLEQDLGVTLFDRGTHRLELTPAGTEFFPHAQQVTGDFDRSIRRMQSLGNLERGTVGVAAVPSVMALLLPHGVAEFMDEHPDVDIYLREDNSEGVQRRVLDGDVDFGVCSLWEPDPNLNFTPVFEDHYGVVFSDHHPLAGGTEPLPWSELNQYRLIGFSPDLGMQYQLSHTLALRPEFREPRYRVSNTSTIEALLRRGPSVSVMSALAAHRPPLNRLQFRLLREPAMSRQVGVVRRQGQSLSSAATTMLRHIQETVPLLGSYYGVEICRRDT
jgi:DNA-binding transcriptional LysR family regulator